MRLATSAVDGTSCGRRQQLEGLGGGQPDEVEPAEAVEAGAGVGCLTHGDEHRDALGAEPAPDERQRHRRLVVEPLGVVDDDEERLGASGFGDEAQDRQADEERVEGVVLRTSECGVQRDPLRCGELPEVVEDREHHLVHAGVAEGHLRLDTGDADDPEVGSRRRWRTGPARTSRCPRGR